MEAGKTSPKTVMLNKNVNMYTNEYLDEPGLFKRFAASKKFHYIWIIAGALILLSLPAIIKSIKQNGTTVTTPTTIVYPADLWRTCCIVASDSSEYNCQINYQSQDVYCDSVDNKFIYLDCLAYGADACVPTFSAPNLVVTYKSKAYNLEILSSMNSFLVIMKNAVSGPTLAFFKKSLSDFTKPMVSTTTRDFWFGLDNMHTFTNLNKYKTTLRIQIKSTGVNVGSFAVTYNTFQVGDSTSVYKLTVGGFLGAPSRDAIAEPTTATHTSNEMPFAGNAAAGRRKRAVCAVVDGWWYKNTCSKSILTSDDGTAGWEYSTTATDIKGAIMAIRFAAV